jgi:hypothetical protein
MDSEPTTHVPGGRVSSEWRFYIAAAWIAVTVWIVVSLGLGLLWLLSEPGSIPEEGPAALITAVFYMSWSVLGLVAFGIGVILGMRWARLAGWRSWLLVIAASTILALVVSVLHYSIGHRFSIGYGVYIGFIVSLVIVLWRSRRPPQPRLTSTGSWTSPGYRSADSRATVAQVLYGLLLLTSVALAVATSGGFELLDRAERFIWEAAAFDDWSSRLDGLDSSHSILAFFAGLSFIIWLSRFVDNVPPLGGGTPKRSPRRVIVYWILPFINLIFLPLILDDVARRQSRDGLGHRALILAWWLLYVFPVIALIWEVPVILDLAGTDWIRNLLILSIIERLAFAVQAVVTIVMIRRLQDDEYLQATHRRSRPDHAPGAGPQPAADAPGAWGRT